MDRKTKAHTFLHLIKFELKDPKFFVLNWKNVTRIQLLKMKKKS